MCEFEKIDDVELLLIDGGSWPSNWFFGFGYDIGQVGRKILKNTIKTGYRI